MPLFLQMMGRIRECYYGHLFRFFKIISKNRLTNSLLQYDFPMSFPQLMVWLGGLGPGGLDTWDPLKQGIVMKGASQF